MTWTTASLRGLTIVAYFVVATVWLPDRILGIGFVRTVPEVVSDLIALGVWGVGLVGGMWMLRIGQERGLI
jgi:hypothetical protein